LLAISMKGTTKMRKIAASIAPCALVALTLSAGAADAGIEGIIFEKGVAFNQTGPTTVTGAGAVFFGAIQHQMGAYDSFALTWPDSSTQPFNLFDEQVGNFSTQPNLDAAYPAGTYIYSATNSSTRTTDSETLDVVADMWPSAIPTLTAASFTAISHAKAGDSLTVDFNSFIPSPLATDSFIGFTVFGLPQATCNLAPTATSCSIDLSGVPTGVPIFWSLFFDNRIQGTTSDGAMTLIDYGYQTSGVPAPVPESSTWAMMLAGFAGAAFAASRQGVRKTRTV
jgi:hypothetical protein